LPPEAAQQGLQHGGVRRHLDETPPDPALVRQLGREAAGIQSVRPHELRPVSITEALDLTGGDLRTVQRFSRHRSLNTLLRYDDHRRDFACEVAQ
jgi:integrase